MLCFQSNPVLTVNIVETSTPEGENGYAVGEIIYYAYVITNDGNLTLTDIYDGCHTISSLAPGGSPMFNDSFCEYLVTYEDAANGFATVEVTVTGEAYGALRNGICNWTGII